jgi:lipopolysaccharide transport system ATP-binding protein
VRLAFAVAAHLEPEILIVDEVLAVGDAQFQKKCLGKMEDVGKEGRTVLFVSHNMGAIRSLCSTGIYLEKSTVKKIGNIETVINSYYDVNNFHSSFYYRNVDISQGIVPELLEIRFDNIVDISQFKSSLPIDILVTYMCANITDLVIGLHVYNNQDVEIIHTSSEFSCVENSQDSNQQTVKIRIPSNSLNLGQYRCKLLLAKRNVAIYDCIENIGFEIIDPDFSVALTHPESWKGILSPKLIQWS